MSSKLNLSSRKKALIDLSHSIDALENDLIYIVEKAEILNPWFTKKNIHTALAAIKNQFLNEQAIDTLIEKYHLTDSAEIKKIGIVCAGNIPLVGWHDIICTFLAGHVAQVKLSDKDTVLVKWMIESLAKIIPETKSYFEIVERLKDYDAAIATGSNSTAQHFEYYFKHVPHIIRRNRNSIAILSGQENAEQLVLLGKDVFDYFGLGCRNVSLICVPIDYNVKRIFEAWEGFDELNLHNKYKNNFDYNVALYLLNKDLFLHNDFVILKESDDIISRIATVHIKRYDTLIELKDWISQNKQSIQCVVSADKIDGIETVSFGESQCPTILTYADGVDTMQFLLSV
jgi:hypothetical protein